MKYPIASKNILDRSAIKQDIPTSVGEIFADNIVALKLGIAETNSNNSWLSLDRISSNNVPTTAKNSNVQNGEIARCDLDEMHVHLYLTDGKELHMLTLDAQKTREALREHGWQV